MTANHNDDQTSPESYDEQFPSEYDDITDASLDDATDAEWVDDEDADNTEDEPVAQPKKKSKLTTIIIIAVAIIGVLGFLVIKGAGQQVPTEPNAAAAVNSLVGLKDTAPTEEPAPTPPPAAEAPAPQGLMDNPAILDQPNTTNSAPAATTEIIPMTAPMTAPQAEEVQAPIATAPVAPTTAPAAPAALSDTITPDIKPVSDFPTVDSIKKPAEDEKIIQVTAEPTQPVAEPTTPAPTTAQEITVAPADTAKINELEKNLADKTAEIQKQKEDAANANSEIQSLKGKIAELEKAAKAQAIPQDELKAATEPKAKEAKTIEKPVVKTEPQKSAATTPAPAIKRTNWVLKSARPGRAVIANQATHDYKTVSIGDTIAGLGKIIAIEETASGWVVKGTLGKVTE